MAWFVDALRQHFLRDVVSWVILGIALSLFAVWVAHNPPQQAPKPHPRNTLGVVSLSLGILTLVGSCTGVGGWAGGLIAEATGVVAYRRYQRGEATNGTMAQAGIILGLISVVLGLMFNAFLREFAEAPW